MVSSSSSRRALYSGSFSPVAGLVRIKTGRYVGQAFPGELAQIVIQGMPSGVGIRQLALAQLQGQAAAAGDLRILGASDRVGKPAPPSRLGLEVVLVREGLLGGLSPGV